MAQPQRDPAVAAPVKKRHLKRFADLAGWRNDLYLMSEIPVGPNKYSRWFGRSPDPNDTRVVDCTPASPEELLPPQAHRAFVHDSPNQWGEAHRAARLGKGLDMAAREVTGRALLAHNAWVTIFYGNEETFLNTVRADFAAPRKAFGWQPLNSLWVD